MTMWCHSHRRACTIYTCSLCALPRHRSLLRPLPFPGCGHGRQVDCRAGAGRRAGHVPDDQRDDVPQQAEGRGARQAQRPAAATGERGANLSIKVLLCHAAALLRAGQVHAQAGDRGGLPRDRQERFAQPRSYPLISFDLITPCLSPRSTRTICGRCSGSWAPTALTRSIPWPLSPSARTAGPPARAAWRWARLTRRRVTWTCRLGRGRP